jgi:hypothetical protein
MLAPVCNPLRNCLLRELRSIGRNKQTAVHVPPPLIASAMSSPCALAFATKLAGAKLAVVVGYSECGAVKYQEDLDSLMSQIDQLAKDLSYNGVNLLDSDDLVVQFNENGTSKLKIAGTTPARQVSASTLSRPIPIPTSMPT